jgi:hypothetical protein
VNPSNYLIKILNTTFLRISWKNATTYEIDKIDDGIIVDKLEFSGISWEISNFDTKLSQR